MQTITEIALARNIDLKSARVAVRRAYEKAGEVMPRETTSETQLPENILALIQSKGAKIGKVNGSTVVEPDAIQGEIKPNDEPKEVPVQSAVKKEKIAPVKASAPPSATVIPAVEKADLLETVLNKKTTVLLALGVCIAVDGYCSGMVSEREIDTPGAFWVFGVLGIVFGFAAIYNAYRLSRKERGKWETNYTGAWIFAFAVFQYLLHGSAFQLFSDWSDLTTQQIISRNLLCVITPLATSALSVTLFAHKKN